MLKLGVRMLLLRFDFLAVVFLLFSFFWRFSYLNNILLFFFFFPCKKFPVKKIKNPFLAKTKNILFLKNFIIDVCVCALFFLRGFQKISKMRFQKIMCVRGKESDTTISPKKVFVLQPQLENVKNK